MQALVTGASGFLGGRLVAMLLADGAEVTVLARPGSMLPEWPRGSVHVCRAEMVQAPRQIFRKQTHVFHCAGCSTDWASFVAYKSGNVDLTGTMLMFAKNYTERLERFLHVSTTDMYGYPAVAGDESMPRKDVGLPYNSTKLRGEELVWQAASAGFPVTVVRPASIYGPGGKAFVTDIVALLKQRLMLLVDGGRAPGGFVYVDDVCRAMLLAATAPHAAGEAYNVSSIDHTNWRTYTHALAAALGLPAPWLSLPFRAAMALASASEVPHRLGIPGRPLLTRHAVYLLARDQEYSTARAREQLGWAPQVGLQEGIARSVAGVR